MVQRHLSYNIALPPGEGEREGEREERGERERETEEGERDVHLITFEMRTPH